MNSRPTALITGATSGIGYALAELFAQNGYNLAITGRNLVVLKSMRDQWQQQYGIDIKHCMKDLAVISTPDEIYQSIQAEMIEVDVLVNNAGFGWKGTFSEMNLSDALEMIQVNITALTQLTRLFLPEMLKRKRGKILNVASTAAFQPGPEMAVYYASKAFVLSFSEALTEEVRGTGVSITTLCPGPKNTNFQQRANMTNTQLFRKLAVMDSKNVAAIGYRGLMKGKRVVVPGIVNKIGVWSTRFVSNTLLMKIVKFMHKEN